MPDLVQRLASQLKVASSGLKEGDKMIEASFSKKTATAPASAPGGAPGNAGGAGRGPRF